MNRKQPYFYLVSLIFVCLTAAAAYYIEQINNDSHLTAARAEVQNRVALLRDRLQGNLNSDVQLAKGLISVITLEPNLTQARFEKVVAPLLDGHTQLRNIVAAPNMVISLVAPLSGNEKAMGLDYRKLPEQFAAADLARSSRKIVLAGPVNLVQGGRVRACLHQRCAGQSLFLGLDQRRH